MKKSIAEIAALVGGTVTGDDQKWISDIRPIEEAGADDLSFVSNPKYFKWLKTTLAGAILVLREPSRRTKT